jgi:hypothetical protein
MPEGKQRGAKLAVQMNTPGGVTGEICYIRNPVGSEAPALTFVTEQDHLSTMVTRPGRQMWITNLRGQEASLDREGFQLVRHKSGIADFNVIEEDAESDQRYIEEMTALLTGLTGAALVLMQGIGKKRYGPTATDRLAGLKNALPALYPHGDTTDISAVELAERIMEFVPGAQLKDFSRWAHINMWRPITPPPQDCPLALCDVRSIAETDRELVVAHTETRDMGDFSFDTTGYLYNPDHRWCYFSDMTPDEVLVFVTHDSDPARPHQVAHTAFLDPTCPAGTPTRGSVEMRALALFA